MVRKVLIANRGEIAVRIARTLRELGVGVVAVFTEADSRSLHVRFSDHAVALGDDPQSYLDIERIVAAARASGADAVHPGYGFLSENADFAAACERAGLTFIGPPSSAIRAMASKQRARALMSAAGVPVVPGGPAETLAEAGESAARVGYPVLIKATDGGGGKGMRRVDAASELEAAWTRTRSEAFSAFGRDSVYVEKVILRPRHVEIQILGDLEGNLVTLFERDCSVQRRHQKIVEETPCPVLDASTLQSMCDVALAGARAIGYHSAGTFEFLLDENGGYYFLEMNTRLQVEHPVTELVTGIDLVAAMIHIAQGDALDVGTVSRRGAAIEARIYAEDPSTGFLPSPGRLSALVEPAGPGVRVDSGVELGSDVITHYDPLLAKLAVWGQNRGQALARLVRALGEYVVLGVETNIEYLRRLALDSDFQLGNYSTSFVETHPELRQRSPLGERERDDLLIALAALEASDRSSGVATLAPPPSQLSPWLLVERARLR